MIAQRRAINHQSKETSVSTIKAESDTTSADNLPGTSLDIQTLAPLWATVFAGMFWITAVRPFTSDIAAALNTSVSIVGQMTTLTMLAIAVAGLFSGPVADHIGHRRSLIFGLGLMAVAAATLALSVNVFMLLAAGLVGGIGVSMTYGVALGVVATRFQGDERRKSLGITHAFGSSATILSAPVLTVIAAWTVWRGSHLFLMLTIVMAMLLVVRLLPEGTTNDKGPLSPLVILKAYRPLWHTRSSLTLFAASAARGVLSIGVAAYIGAYYIDRYGMSIREVGFVSMIEGMGLVAGSIIGGSYLNRFSQRPLFAAAIAMIGTGWLTVYAVHPPVVMAVATVVTITVLIGMTMTILTSLIAEESPCGAATTMVLNISVIGFGGALGAGYGGLLVGLGGYTALGIGTLPFAFVSALLVWNPARSAEGIAHGLSKPAGATD
jgi:predicted MFS family arabinose efflux permease